MALKSIYDPELVSLEKSGLIRITGDEHRHLLVARAAPGELIEAFDGKGFVWTVRVVSVSKKEALAEIVEKRITDRDPHELVLGLALIRPSAFELALEKVVEVGVTRIVPFSAARSNVSAPRRPDRWLKILVEAAKQSKRFHLPVLQEPVELDRILSFSASRKIVFTEHGGGSLPTTFGDGPVLYLVGPEGGWTDGELDRMKEHGFELVSLGAGILKAETAAIVGGALIQYEWRGTQ